MAIDETRDPVQRTLALWGVIGVILTSRQDSVLAGGVPVEAFLSGYCLALVVAGALVLAGAFASWPALRKAENAPVLNEDVVLAA